MVERKGISPLPEELEYSGPVQCPVEGCGKELPSSACLRMHVVRRHHGKRLERVSGSRENSECVDFFCPVRGCNRSREGGEPFPRLGQLKQHYQTIHGLKNHTCIHCGKKFALRDVCNRHQQECQQKIVCSTCGLDFRTRNALYQHAKRKGHTLPDGKKVKTNLKRDRESNDVTVVLVPIPTSVKLVVPVSKKQTLVSNSTQTEESCTQNLSTERSPEVKVQSSSSQTMSELPPCPFNHTHLLRSPSELLSLGTQTTFPAPETTPLVVSTQACQTQAAQLCDFGTQTLSDANCAAMPLDVSGTCMCTSNSVSDYSDASALVEFGTQTVQSESYNISESDMVDFGTQTNGMSGLELDDSLFILPPECMDFGTQTLDFAYDYVSQSVQTCLHTCSTDTRDQGSQT